MLAARLWKSKEGSWEKYEDPNPENGHVYTMDLTEQLPFIKDKIALYMNVFNSNKIYFERFFLFQPKIFINN